VIAIAVCGPNFAERCVTLEAGMLQIGRRSHYEIVLPGDGVTRLHARITVAHGRAVLVDAGSTSGTFLNGVRITGPVALSPRDRITIGAYTLEVLSTDAPAPPPPPLLSGNPAEAALLAEFERSDDPAPLLLVYADWLEQTGQPRPAELLRRQHELAALDPRDASFPQRRKQLRQLAADDDLGWRILVARAPIEQCPVVSAPAAAPHSSPRPHLSPNPRPRPHARAPANGAASPALTGPTCAPAAPAATASSTAPRWTRHAATPCVASPPPSTPRPAASLAASAPRPSPTRPARHPAYAEMHSKTYLSNNNWHLYLILKHTESGHIGDVQCLHRCLGANRHLAGVPQFDSDPDSLLHCELHTHRNRTEFLVRDR
jgi:uncharacterized protein (TIGR02996 family)